MKKFRMSLLPNLLIASVLLLAASGAFAQSQQEPWVAPPEADKLVNPVKADKEVLKTGEALYMSECKVCHGSNGDGVSDVGKNLKQKPKNFTADDFLTQSDGAIFWKLSEGRGLMQPFKTMLTEEEIWSVVMYVKILAEKGN